jgi:hypothetical protein
MRDYQLQKDATEVRMSIDSKINDVNRILERKVNLNDLE